MLSDNGDCDSKNDGYAITSAFSSIEWYDLNCRCGVCAHKLRVNDFSINILVCAKSNTKIKQLNQFKQSIKIVITSFWHVKEQLVNELVCKYTWI